MARNAQPRMMRKGTPTAISCITADQKNTVMSAHHLRACGTCVRVFVCVCVCVCICLCVCACVVRLQALARKQSSAGPELAGRRSAHLLMPKRMSGK